MTAAISEPMIISARRAYEFNRDDIRITSFSRSEVVDRIQQAFDFHSGGIDRPEPDFGLARPTTYPPGLEFRIGHFEVSEGVSVPIRSIGIDYRRIVIEVAGPSSAISTIYTNLRTILDAFPAADGRPSIGNAAAIKDQSEIVMNGEFDPAAVLAPGLPELFTRVLGAWGDVGNAELVPDIRAGLLVSGTEYEPWSYADLGTVRFALRTERQSKDRRYFSVAPLDTEAHMQYLSELATLLSR